MKCDNKTSRNNVKLNLIKDYASRDAQIPVKPGAPQTAAIGRHPHLLNTAGAQFRARFHLKKFLVLSYAKSIVFNTNETQIDKCQSYKV